MNLKHRIGFWLNKKKEKFSIRYRNMWKLPRIYPFTSDARGVNDDKIEWNTPTQAWLRRCEVGKIWRIVFPSVFLFILISNPTTDAFGSTRAIGMPNIDDSGCVIVPKPKINYKVLPIFWSQFSSSNCLMLSTHCGKYICVFRVVCENGLAVNRSMTTAMWWLLSSSR